ncbi:MAG: purine-nucleoside phosphorylase, partial [Alphaproteobacteria bacterium]
DQFYADAPDHLGKFIEYGVLAVEMEANAIYSLAAKFGVEALAICAVSDNIITGEQISATERQASLNEMMTLALETAISE